MISQANCRRGLLVLLFHSSYLYGMQKTAMLDFWQWGPIAAPDIADCQALCLVPGLATPGRSPWAGTLQPKLVIRKWSWPISHLKMEQCSWWKKKSVPNCPGCVCWGQWCRHIYAHINGSQKKISGVDAQVLSTILFSGRISYGPMTHHRG